MLKADCTPATCTASTWEHARADDFVLPPLPNHLFQRDNSCWIYGGVTINPMAKPARQRETLHSRAIYRYHPLFTDAEFDIWYGDDDADHLPATIEGGDVHVVGHGTVLIGMGERTTPMAVEILARALFANGPGRPRRRDRAAASHAFMHLDTLMTMVDRGTFVLYPYLDRHLRSWTHHARRRARDAVTCIANQDLWETIAEALEVDKVTVLKADEDVRAAEREQWDDGTNFLAVAPGVVLRLRAQRRHQHHAPQARHRGRRDRRQRARTRPGGPRCMTCPIERDAGLRSDDMTIDLPDGAS